jgi:hypothetical protein
MKSEKIICDECGTPVAERRKDGTVVIRARHHGREHVTIIPPWSVSKQVFLSDVETEIAPGAHLEAPGVSPLTS